MKIASAKQSKKPLDKMSFQEVSMLKDQLKYIIRGDEIYNKVLLKKHIADIDPIIEDSIIRIRQANVQTMYDNPAITMLKRYNILRLQPYNLVARFVNHNRDTAFYKILRDNVQQGMIDALGKEKEITEMVEKDIKKYVPDFDPEEWSLVKNRERVKFQQGSMPLNPLEKISLFLDAEQKAGRQHLYEGGLEDENANRVVMTKDDVSWIRKRKDGLLNQQEMALAKIVNKHLNSIIQNSLNEVGMKLYGFKIAKEQNYFRLHADKLAKDRKPQSYHTAQGAPKRMELAGDLIGRVENPKTPLFRVNAYKAFIDSAKFASEFYGMAIPIRNARMIIGNGQLTDAIRQKHGTETYKTLENYINDVEGTFQRKTKIEEFLTNIHRRATTTVLGLTWTTPLKQIPSIINGMSDLGTGPWLAEGLKNNVVDKHMFDHPMMWARLQGRVTREVYEAMVNDLGGKTLNRINQMRSISMKGILKADMFVMTKLWNMAKAKHKIQNNGKVNYEKLNKEFTKLVTETQPFWTETELSEMMRSRNIASRIITQFRTQREVNFNMLYRDLMKGQKTGDYRQFARTLGHQTAAQLSIALVDTLRHSLRTDDEDTWKVFMSYAALALAGVGPIASLVTNQVLFGWGAGTLVVDAINSNLELISALTNDPTKNPKGTARKLVRAISYDTGIPVDNLIKSIEDGYKVGRGTLDILK